MAGFEHWTQQATKKTGYDIQLVLSISHSALVFEQTRMNGKPI